MTTGRDIKRRVRERAEKLRKQREAAVVAVNDAVAHAVSVLEDHESELRTVFAAALAARGDSERHAQLRAAFEAALADDPKVRVAELAAGRAILAVTSPGATVKVPQSELAELLDLRVEDLRAFAALARATGSPASGERETESHTEATLPVAALAGMAGVDRPVSPADGEEVEYPSAAAN